VWWDGLIEGGEIFSDSIEIPLKQALAVVVVWSRTSHDSHWVLDEAASGRDRHRLVPVSIDGSMPPLGFRQFQTIAIKRPRRGAGDAGIDAMLRAVAVLHDQPAPARQLSVARLGTGVDRRTLIGGGAVVAAAAAGGAWWAGLIGSPGAAANSIAVLPFDNLSGDPDRAYFSDGLASEVRSALASNPHLQVAAQTSSNSFRSSDDDARKISRALGVTYLLDGNVRRSGEMMRISAELIEGRTGFSRWAQTFDRPTENVFAVQEEIARSVIDALTAQVIGKKPNTGRKAAGGTTNLVAYDAYLRGKDLYDRAADEAGDLAALASFDRAITADPNYALPYAARARSLAVIGNQYEQGASRRARYDAAIAAGRRAVALAPDVAETQSALGFALFYGRIDVRAARPHYERSFELGRGDADVLARYALFSARYGNFRAARPTIARAATLDPLNARTFRLMGEIEYAARQYRASIPHYERALGLNPSLSVAHSSVGDSRYMLGEFKAARAEYVREPSSLFRLTGLAIVDRKLARIADSEKSFAALAAEHGDNGLYQQAQILAQWNRPEDAVKALLNAYKKGDAGLSHLHGDPMLDPLRRDARVIRLLQRLGFA
jgi:TolB-like protein/Tfp pilus assembly protein PilF